MKQKHKLWIRSIIIALSSILLAAVLQLTGAFDAFENKTYDLRMVQAAEYKTPCDEIAFIVVDQESITWAKETYGWSWPWPREAYGRIINFFSAGNPEAIAFDILYTEPSVYGESDDIALGEAEAKSKKVIQTLFYSPSDYDEPLPPVTPIYENAALLGNITSSKDKDDIIRRSRIVDNIAGKDYPTLGLAPLFLNEEKPDFSNLPLLDDGTVLLRFTKTIDDYHPYSAKSILESYDQWLKDKDNVDRNEYFVPEDFDGLYIFGAYYAPGLFDICSTPVSQVYPGVGVHITALDNYLTDSFIRKVPVYVSIIWMVLLAFLATLIVAVSESKFPRFSTIIISAGIVIGIAVAVIVPVILFDNGIWIYLVSPLFAFILSGVTSLLVSLSVEGKQKRFIRSAFSQCLSKDVVNQIINDSSSFTLGGKEFHMSAIFTDIQKFSSFSELLTAGQLGSLLNFYLTKMSDIIIDERGTVDKYEGDAIVALVGAPVAMEDHASHACRAAIKMKKAELIMNQDIISYASNPKPSWMEDDLYSAFKTLVSNGKTIFTRIGINSGEMIAGYFGSEKKKNYTMMGNNVNLASRLEGVNKQYHTNGILISQATRELLDDDFIIRSLDRVRVVNINTPIQLYEVIDERSSASVELLDYLQQWETAMGKFNERNYQKAKEILTELAAKDCNDNVAKYYIHLLDDYFLKGKYPTASDNEGVEFNPEDGVFKLLQK